jgi:hypothetical protein
MPFWTGDTDLRQVVYSQFRGAFSLSRAAPPTPRVGGSRLNRGGHRQANAALYRAVIVRMQHHEPTRAYVARRTLEGKSKAEIIRCLKRLLARETWALLRPLRTVPRTASAAA